MTAAILLVSRDPWLRSLLPIALEQATGQPVSAVAVVEDASAAQQVSMVLLDTAASTAPVTDLIGPLVERGIGPVLVLHEQADILKLTECLEAGAAGFQTTELTVDELAASISSVLRGEAVVPRRLLGALLGNLIQRRRRDNEAAARFARLTRREREILTLVADGEDRQSIARALFISPQTARTHIQNMLTKLEVHSRIEAARFAHDHGYADNLRQAMS
jgi:DNA-binding NarL/FixJ family response regulator